MARKIAADLGIDLASVSGTGFGGKITKEDILAISAPAQVKEAAAAPVVEAKPEKSCQKAWKLSQCLLCVRLFLRE